MAKCIQCGQSGIFIKTIDNLCDHCTILNLRSELSKAHELNQNLTRQLKQMEERLDDALREVAAYNAEHAALESIRVSDAAEHTTRDPFVLEVGDALSRASTQVSRAPTQALVIEKLQQYLDLFDRLRAQCHEKGSPYAEWFEKRYCQKYPYREHSYNQLQECIARRDAGLQDPSLAVDNLGNRVLDVIRSHEGILQRDLGKEFELSLRNHVRNILYQLEQCGAIRREKNGSSYNLYTIHDGEAFTALTHEPSGGILAETKFCHFCSCSRPIYENNVCAVCRHSVI